MTKIDLANAIVPHLIAVLPQPFSPDDVRARQVLEAASKWTELIHSEATKDAKLQMFTLG